MPVVALIAAMAAPAMAQSSPASAISSQRTIIRDQAAANRLLGNEGITLQWIDWDHRGDLDVAMPGDTIFLKGGQHRASGPGALTLDGRVTEINATSFRFHGRIVITDTPDIGRNCVRDGDFTFAITQNRKYWRLQEMEMCDGLTDYVDIYF
ncbi:MAG TPA: hypothetical protein VF503_05640 [Sphingobium sp.]|uniref:hypothetical protein n=1 Tax=Sphingobium sp. TaxID=1912891 RepID=UPI002ED5FBD5